MVTHTYFDASAAMKLLIDEPGTSELIDELRAQERHLVAGWLLHTELHCAAGRRQGVDPANVERVLGGIALTDLTRGDFIAAGMHAPLRSNDALHLAVAVRLGVDEMMTYDAELAEVAARAGLRVISPGA